QADDWIGLATRTDQDVDQGAVIRVIAGGVHQPGDILANSAVIQITVRVAKMLFEELLVPPFKQHEQPERPSVQINGGVSSPRRWDPGRQEKLARDLFGNITRILNRIVQGDLLQSVET